MLATVEGYGVGYRRRLRSTRTRSGTDVRVLTQGARALALARVEGCQIGWCKGSCGGVPRIGDAPGQSHCGPEPFTSSQVADQVKWLILGCKLPGRHKLPGT